MNLESSIKDVITKKLEDGTVEKLIEEQLEKGINQALSQLFGSYGDVTKLLEQKVKSVMVPYLEKRDYSEYIVKLDDVLAEILQEATLPNQLLLRKFKNLMVPETAKERNVSDLFRMWKEHVAENVETDDLEIDYDGDPSYYPVEVTMTFEMDDRPSWSSFDYGTLLFECEHDEKMNFAIRLSKYEKEKEWSMSYRHSPEIRSIRYLSDFEIILMRLDQASTKLILDTDYENDEVYPEKEPDISLV